MEFTEVIEGRRSIRHFLDEEVPEQDIRSIILNKRKVQFVHDLENNIYKDALNRGDFTIY